MLGDQSIRQSFHQSYWPVCGFSYISKIPDPGLLLPKPQGDSECRCRPNIPGVPGASSATSP